MSEQVDPAHVAVSFIFAIARKMPRDRKSVEQVPAVAAQGSMITRQCKARDMVSKALHVAITTYRPSVFVDHPEFALAVQAAHTHGAELVLADPFSFMRNLDSATALRCMKILDTLPMAIINAYDGRVWKRYSASEKQNLYLAAKSATMMRGSGIKKGLPDQSASKARIPKETRDRAGAALTRAADRRALELKKAVDRIRSDAGKAALSPTAVANELNQLGHTTARGSAWSATTAKRLLHRLQQLQADAPTMDQKQQ